MNNPFNNNSEDTSFEQGSPVTQAVKNATKATSVQANIQAQATTQAIVDQLYGVSDSTPTDAGTDEANTQHTDSSNAAIRAVSSQSGAQKSSNSNQTPEEEAKMEKIRHELFGNYSGKFQSAQNGAHGLNTNLDQEMEKARQERKQKEQQREQEQEEEEEKQRLEAEKAQMDEGLGSLMPQGKNTGRNRMKQPVALTQAKTKTEINRGATG
jgi:hypothetical protein